jgi:hypothetical protein
MDEKELQERYMRWLEYWCGAIIQQHIADKTLEASDGPMYRDDTDRAINGIIVAALLDSIDGLERQFLRMTK